MKILVTGASGFVGRALLERLRAEGDVQVVAAVRRRVEDPVRGVTYVRVGDLTSEADWTRYLGDVDVVIHAAARVHQVRDTARDPRSEFRRVNVAGSMELAKQAAEAGVRRFILISTVKVNGECSVPERPFRPDDPPAPGDPYGQSKHEAEIALRTLSQTSAMDVVVIRPPLVYGPGVRANFLALMRWIHRRRPVLVGRPDNQRSLVALGNLVDFITASARHPAAANRTFLISDDDDVSTRELAYRIGAALGTPARIVAVPNGIIRTAATLVGKRSQVDKLLGSLQVDISKARKLLDWSPMVTMDIALRDTAEHFLRTMRS